VDVEALEREAGEAISSASSPEELDEARVRYLGRKSALKQALRAVRDRETGITLNAVRERLEAAIGAREAELERAQLAELDASLDVTLPGTRLPRGRLHPLTQIIPKSRTSSSGWATRSSTAGRSKPSGTTSTPSTSP